MPAEVRREGWPQLVSHALTSTYRTPTEGDPLKENLEDTRPPDEEAREVNLLCLLQRVWTYSFTTKADLARAYADEIAEAASRGFITTAVVPGRPIHGRLWKVTPTGLQHLWANAQAIADEEVRNYVASFCEQ